MQNIEQIQKTKRLISLSLCSLIMKKEYENISVKEICDKANISRMTFYRYYNNKDGIFVEFSDARFEEFFGQCKKEKDMTNEKFILDMFLFFKRYGRQLLILKKAKKESILMPQFHSYIKYFVNHAKNITLIKNKKDDIEIAFVAGGLLSVIIAWLNDNLSTPPEKMASSFLKVVSR